MDDIVKLNSMESSSTLFEKAIPVRITKSTGSESDRLIELTVRIVMGISKVHRSSKLLRMQLTNEADPFFLYFLEVSEDDFQTLKVEQCILVDFNTFPYKFIELLEHCIDAGNHDAPRFQAILNVRTGDSTFSVVEANQFKHLSHLSLCFRQGNDTTIKTYLAGRLAEFKAANTDMHEKLRRTLLSLEMALRDNSNLSSELADLRENNSRTINQLKSEYNLEMAHEKERAIQECADTKERYEKDRLDLENRFRQQSEMQQGRIMDLDNQVRSLLDSKHCLELKIAELGTRLANSDKDLDEKIQECERLRAENHNMDCDRQESLRTLNQHLVRLAALDQEVQDKTELITTLQKQLDNQTTQRTSLELSLKDAQAAVDRAEEKNKANESELNKCRQSVEKLQAELKTCKAKVKLKGQMASQQDNLLVERQTAIDRTTQENTSLKQEITTVKEDNESLKKKVDEMKTKLDESQESQRSNQQMIQWLNQQLTDAQLGKLGSASVSTRYMVRPNLSYLAGQEPVARATTNHGGPVFSASASLNGVMPQTTTFKSILRSTSPFGTSIHPKPSGSTVSTVSNTISTLTTKSNRPGSRSTSPLHSNPVPYKPSKPLAHLVSNSDMPAAASITANLCSGMDKLDTNCDHLQLDSFSKQQRDPANVKESLTKQQRDPAMKEDESAWTLLPRPPLSFVEARSELLKWTGKKGQSPESKSGQENREAPVHPTKVAVRADSYQSKSISKSSSSPGV